MRSDVSERWHSEVEPRERAMGALGSVLVLLGLLLGLGLGAWAGTVAFERVRPFSAEAAITGGAGVEGEETLRSASPDAPPLPPSPLERFFSLSLDTGLRIGAGLGAGLAGGLVGALITSSLCAGAGLRRE